MFKVSLASVARRPALSRLMTVALLAVMCAYLISLDPLATKNTLRTREGTTTAARPEGSEMREGKPKAWPYEDELYEAVHNGVAVYSSAVPTICALPSIFALMVGRPRKDVSKADWLIIIGFFLLLFGMGACAYIPCRMAFALLRSGLWLGLAGHALACTGMLFEPDDQAK